MIFLGEDKSLNMAQRGQRLILCEIFGTYNKNVCGSQRVNIYQNHEKYA